MAGKPDRAAIRARLLADLGPLASPQLLLLDRLADLAFAANCLLETLEAWFEEGPSIGFGMWRCEQAGGVACAAPH